MRGDQKRVAQCEATLLLSQLSAEEVVHPLPHFGRNLIGAKTKLFYPGAQ